VRQVLQGNGWVREVQSELEEGHYQVAIDRQGEYEISRLTPIQNLTPALNIDAVESPVEVVKRLVHLVKYQAAQDLDNPSSELNKAIEYELLDDEKQPLPDPNNISLKSGDRVYVRLKNISPQPLSVAILDFEATWEISQIPIQGDRGAFYSLQPQEETFTRLRFNIPDGANYQQAKETLKLFVTQGLANFQWLILPSLDKEADAAHQAMRGMLNAGLKAEVNPSPLAKLLSTLGANIDTPPPVRSAVYDPDPNAEWLTKSILLTVKQQ
jgi:hypothetical protein